MLMPGQYSYARSELFKSADGAAQEVDAGQDMATADVALQTSTSASERATAYEACNADYLASRRIYPRLTAIWGR